MRPPRKGVAYSEALAKAYATDPEDEIVLDTLEFLHPTFLDADGVVMGIRVVNEHDSLTAFLEDDAPLNSGEEVLFQPVYFSLTRPAESESGATQELQVKVDNVSQILIPYVELAKETRIPITMIWRPYLATDLSGPHQVPVLSLTLSGIGGDMNSLTARAGFSSITNRRFPASEYTLRKFSTLTVR